MEEKDILKILEDSYLDSKKFVEEDCFHHNTKYKDALRCLKYGILSAKNQRKINVERKTEFEMYGMKLPTSNVNGDDCVSIARVVNEYPFGDKFFYSPYSPSEVDIIIDKVIQNRFNVCHNSQNYYNEYLVTEGIVPSIYFKSLNLRFHNMIEYLLKINHFNKITEIDVNNIFVSNFLYLLEICKLIDYSNLDINLCEVDNEGYIHRLDIKQLSKVK